jgi:plastocyanin domain-containing protein
MRKHAILLTVCVTLLLLIGIGVLLAKNRELTREETVTNTTDAVQIVDNKQIISITAKGGYTPRSLVAQAGIPSILAVQTKGTFDCSAALTIPSIGYRSMLPPSGITEIAIPPQPAGTTLHGTCSMGMYTFTITFRAP